MVELIGGNISPDIGGGGCSCNCSCGCVCSCYQSDLNSNTNSHAASVQSSTSLLNDSQASVNTVPCGTLKQY
ncbi:MAG: hypothetical protein HZB59_07040 [Ignavibacteriales bacterium]|nr:hypothetical protein [Ignavibacteriales bacterium]